ncbi:hypothetical protein BHM03_00002664 [Ensete ventricosum]|nr:hypothetical protein BHM03_00002664 [Ensete ventricosum]
MVASTIGGATSWFSYEELYEITDGFSPQNILGEGGFGCVYKGCLSDGREVAVKQLKVGSGQGEREFQAEVEIISRVHHRHLVSLVGYCISENQRLLVYDFVPNGTLESHLHGKRRPAMDWATRVKVAAGAAGGIAYLHEDCMNSSPTLGSHMSTATVVFHQARPLLAHAIETGEFGELPDPRLEDDYDDTEMFRMIEAAGACTRHSAAMRPRMGKVSITRSSHPIYFLISGVEKPCLLCSWLQVVRVLDSLSDVDLHNGVKPGQSEVFNVGRTADIRLFQRLAFGSQEFSSEYSQSNWSRQSDL